MGLQTAGLDREAEFILTVKPGFQAYRECKKETHQQPVNRLLSVVKPCCDHCGNIMFYVDNSDVDACVII